MGKAQSFLSSIQPLRGASIRGDRQQEKPSPAPGSLGVVGSAERWLQVSARRGMFAAQGCQGSEDSPAQLGCIFFGCTEWKILACRQNRRCEEEHGVVCPLQEPGLEQQAPHMAKLFQLWAAGERGWNIAILNHPMLGIAFTAASYLGILHGKVFFQEGEKSSLPSHSLLRMLGKGSVFICQCLQK